MSKEESLTYTVAVDPDTEYEIKVRVGDAQEGTHNVFGTCPFETEPINDEPEWISLLGDGAEIKDKVLYIVSGTQNINPDTNFVSVRVFINDEQIEPDSGDYAFEVEEHEIVYFNQKIDFV